MSDPAIQSAAHYNGGGSTTCAVAFTSNNTAGNSLYISVWTRQEPLTFTVSDSIGNTYPSSGAPLDHLSGFPVSTTYGVAQWAIVNCKGGANTVTVTASGSCEMIVTVIELPASAGVRVHNSASGTTGNAVVSLASTVNNDVCASVTSNPNGTTSTSTFGSNAGFTESNLFNINFAGDGNSSGGTINATWGTTSGDWGICALAFQPAAATVVQPESWYPDAARVPTSRADRMQSFGDPGRNTGSGEATKLNWWEVYPDRVERPRLGPAEHEAFATSPQPERTAPMADKWHPDWVQRLSMGVADQQAATGLPPQPEGALPLDWQPWYPERVFRPAMLAAAMPFFALAPAPERTSTLIDQWHPDSVSRPYLQTAQQLAATELPPKPEDVLPDNWQPWYPDRIWRPALLTAQHQAFALYTVPIVSVLPTQAPVWWPDSVQRPTLQVAQQQASALWPQPISFLSTQFPVWYPDSVSRPVLHPSRQQSSLSIPPLPITGISVTQPLVWYPDGVVRPMMLAAQQLAATELSPAPERKSPLADQWHPDAIYRPSLHASQQLAASELPPKPERTSPLADQWHPDRIVLPMPVPWQQAFATSPQPEITRQGDFFTSYPDRVVRPTYPVVQQQAHALGPSPLPNPIQFPVHFPDWINRPYPLASFGQGAYTPPFAPFIQVAVYVIMPTSSTLAPVMATSSTLTAIMPTSRTR